MGFGANAAYMIYTYTYKEYVNDRLGQIRETFERIKY